ncbi:ribosome maturation factor RimM [Pseudemcibacter aquimaris]|uniref:ribosome maturation factor RimM n=1 Tax=Pseudemcibacter aquimaris TaxID=2857064 RepID=UPI0020111AC9|nr:ribosome maturation factor RimM [Pseudemcibacter aquimaris]MCC3861965.1 ribosome maturation factor RimM [Pseudemcibacter aquimaris]WDU58717.1 ribosome maturation factor RimM [Pseudemcibacter aquimaris]
MAHPRKYDDEAPREDLICLGAVFGASGIRGAVRLKVFTEDLKAISQYGPVTIFSQDHKDGKKYKVKILHEVKGGVAATLKGVNDRNKAEALKGAKLYIERSALPDIEEEDGFYFEDLVGLMARDTEGSQFGKVEGVYNFGAGDIIEVNLSKEKGKRMYPFSDEVVPEVNIEEGYIVVNRDAFNDGEEDRENSKKG